MFEVQWHPLVFEDCSRIVHLDWKLLWKDPGRRTGIHCPTCAEPDRANMDVIVCKLKTVEILVPLLKETNVIE